ncbi:MAG: transporter substrate binding inner rane protein [Alphaproteobacteria bacterium]|nr:transporter substrate binding inner rane protein [Alphaproteobacteria bacterium]
MRGGGKRAAALLLAPGVLLFAVFVIYPIAASFVLSLQSWNGLGAKTWIGFGNYAELFSDHVFYTALANNLLWLGLNALAPVLGLGIAVLVNQAIPGIRILRALFFLPFVISAVVVGMVFGWFFNAEFGLLNALLAPLGAELAPLDSEDGAIFAVIAAALWPQTAYCAILYLTGLMSLQPELIDAARIDGARGLRLLWQIVLPQLAPVNFIVALISVVSALRGFDMVVIMTAGGPYDSSTVLAHYMYEQTFHASRYGYGAAIASVLFALMAAGVGFFLWRMLRREAA